MKAMRVVNGDVSGVEAFNHFHPFYEGSPSFSMVERFVHAAARHGEVEMLGVARIDDDRVQFRPVRCAVLLAAHP